jgi:hypothetical protein
VGPSSETSNLRIAFTTYHINSLLLEEVGYRVPACESNADTVN